MKHSTHLRARFPHHASRGLIAVGVLLFCSGATVEALAPQQPAVIVTTVESTGATSTVPLTIAPSTTEPIAATTSSTPARPESASEPATINCQPLSAMTPRQILATLIMVGVDPSDPDSVKRLAATTEPPGGVFIGGNATDVFATLPQVTQSSPMLVAVDDEGGRVQRIEMLEGDLPSARAQAETMSANEVRSMATQRARQLRALGVNMNFAPVVDLSSQPEDDVIGDRSYSSDAQRTTLYAGAYSQGMRAEGVLPTLKHFPGHGGGDGDSHKGGVTTPSLDSLEKSDITPYRYLIADGNVAVMVGHLQVPGLTEPGLPTSLSPATYTYLRVEVGFSGLVVTDDLGGMRAVSAAYSEPEAAVAAISAGADLALFSGSTEVRPLVDALDAARTSGRLGAARVNEAVARVRSAQGCRQ